MGEILARAPQLATRNLMGNLRLNYDWRAFIHEIEQLDHVRIPHPHATAAVGGADLVLMFGSMDVNESVARIGIMIVQSVEP